MDMDQSISTKKVASKNPLVTKAIKGNNNALQLRGALEWKN